MSNSARWRRRGLGITLAATIAAMLYPVEQEQSAIPQPPHAAAASVEVLVETVPDKAMSNLPWKVAGDDPFAPRGWVAPPAPEPAPPPPAQTLAPVPAPVPLSLPPLLPYKFVGQMRDGSDTVVYLSHGDQIVLAHAGESLDSGYKVVAITASQIEFESAASGIRQTLTIPNQE